MATACPSCGSERTRRGGNAIWAVYVLLIGVGIPGVLLFHLHAGIVAAIVVFGAVAAHLLFDTRVCLDCGAEWRAGDGRHE